MCRRRAMLVMVCDEVLDPAGSSTYSHWAEPFE